MHDITGAMGKTDFYAGANIGHHDIAFMHRITEIESDFAAIRAQKIGVPLKCADCADDVARYDA